jgi:O-antigen/teichoic acid export membrane protein
MAMHRYDISSRIGLGQSLVRSLGIILLVVAGLGVIHVVVWEVLVSLMMLVIHVLVAKRLMTGVRWIPSMSFIGIREIFGYSVFTFLTHIFLTVYRESGKLILGNRVGTASVAYLGTPDSIAHRLHTVVVSGIETLMPRFSASRGLENTKTLLVTATWAAMASGIVLYLPLAVLMPDFLRLWINPEFARESAAVGQLLVLSFIAPSGFAPIATLFRGIGRPGLVTLIMAAAGLAVLVTTLLMVSSHGPLGVAYGYVLSAVAWFGGLFGGWLHLYGRRSIGLLLRVAGLPLLLGCGLGVGQAAFRGWCGELGWVGLFAVGGAFAAVNAVVLFGADRILGGDSPAEHVMGRVLLSGRMGALLRRLRMA